MDKKPHSRPKGRPSTHISLASGRNLHHACRYALPYGGNQARRGCPTANVNAGKPLNLSVTIQWEMTETGEDNFAALRNQRFCRWLRTRSKQLGVTIEPTYVYAREGQSHVHWLVHVPDELIAEFMDLVPRWITSLEHRGKGSRKRAENHEPAPQGTVLIEPVRNSVAARKYLLKGINPQHAVRLGIRNPTPQGLLFGPRTGVSRNLSRKARKKAGYRAREAVWQRNNGRIILPPTIAAVSRQASSP